MRPLLACLALATLAACTTPPAPPPAPYRSAAQVSEFRRAHPCPATGLPRGPCPGYVVDHIIALACGGPDAPANMQWQTVADAKAKDRWELKSCRP